MICSNRTGWTDTRCSFWRQKPLNVLQRLCFPKLKPIPWDLWSLQVTRALAIVWASGGPKEGTLFGDPVWLAVWAAETGTQQEHRELPAPYSPTTPTGGTGRALSPFNTSSLPLEQEVTACSWRSLMNPDNTCLWQINSKQAFGVLWALSVYLT